MSGPPSPGAGVPTGAGLSSGAEPSPPSSGASRLAEVCQVFLRLGCTAFGGPAAHIGLLEEETVRRRGWVRREEFLDMLGATNLIPGPNSTEMCIHLGYRRAGFPGLVAAGACFILPAACITAVLAWAYVRFGKLPAMEAMLFGVKPAVLAVILGAIGRLARTAFKDAFLGAVGLAAAAASFAGASEILVLFAGGLLGVLRAARSGGPGSGTALAAGIVGLPPAMGTTGVPGLGMAAAGAAAGAAGAAGTVGLLSLGLFFLKVGGLLYGTGYVLLAFLRSGLVVERGWLTETQLLDAVAVGQFTPGPLLSTATFIGYILAGGAGAAVATFCIFLPSFIFVWITHPWIPRLRRSRLAAGFLDAVNAAAMGLMAAVLFFLGRDALQSWPAVAIGALAITGTLLTRWNPTWWIVAGASLGLLAGGAGLVAGVGTP